MSKKSDLPPILVDAKRIAEDPSAEVDDLLSAAARLLGGGLFEDAERAVLRIEASGRYPQEARHLRFAIERLSQAGPDFQEHLLVNAAKTARNPSATEEQLLKAAVDLVKWGALDEADHAMDRLDRAGRSAPALWETSRQLRRSGILSSFTPIGHPITGALSRPFEALLSSNPNGSDKIIVVFTGAARRFWLGLHVLHHFLKKFETHVVYLSDHRGRMYLDGLGDHGTGYQGLLKLVKAATAEAGATKAYVMANSAGGFVGLRVAQDLRAVSYLGMCIRTDLSGQHRLGAYERRVAEQCDDKGMLTNLRARLANQPFPERIELLCGDTNDLDVEHAENLRGLINVRLRYLTDYRMHDIMPGLLARGQFEEVLGEFMA